MNDDMPWVDLTPEEIQQLRTNKQQLTEYGKQKIRELMNDGKLRFYDKGKETFTIDDSSWGKIQTPEIKLEIKEMTHEEMLEEAERRENEQNAELEDAQNGFVEWFNDLNGGYSLRSEWFYGDCEVEDEKTRKDLMYKWIHAAYVSGYNSGMKLYGGTE